MIDLYFRKSLIVICNINLIPLPPLSPFIYVEFHLTDSTMAFVDGKKEVRPQSYISDGPSHW